MTEKYFTTQSAKCLPKLSVPADAVRASGNIMDRANLILLAEASRISVCYAIVKYFSVIAGIYFIRIQYYSIIYNMYMVEGEEEFYNFFVSPTHVGVLAKRS